MKRRALRRRYGHAEKLWPRYGLSPERFRHDLGHEYREILVSIRTNPGESRARWRDWMAKIGIHKAVTDRILSTAERRGHLEYRHGGYFLTPKGYDAAWPEMRNEPGIGA